MQFVQTFIKFWHAQPALRRRRFFHDRATRGTSVKDIQWFDPSGAEMTEKEWKCEFARSLGWLLRGDAIDVNDRGEAVSGENLLILFAQIMAAKSNSCCPHAKEAAPGV